MNANSRRPTEREIVPALLDAVERLCAETSPEDIRMQDIASSAGLSTGAAYRYYKSKNDLLGAALARIGERLASATVEHDDTEAAIAALWQALDDNPAFPNIATWAIVSGHNPASMMSKYPVARDVASTAAKNGAKNPPMVAAMTLLLGIAGAVYGETINLALQRDADDREIYDTAAEMLANWIAGDPGDIR